jgi:protein-S-isoprenylcysteine O-methyltransferase Ste14
MRRYFASSPRQTFVLFPLAVFAFDVLVRRRVRVDLRWAPLLALGYGLYRTAGEHRERSAAGPRGFERPPVKLLTDGPYAYTRNPMYLGHLIFCTALFGATRSPVALLLALRQARRLAERVRADEARLERIFGDEYRAYVARVPRWIGLPRVSAVHGTPVETNGTWQRPEREGA